MIYAKINYIHKFLKKEKISDSELSAAISDLHKGRAVSLGGNLYKVRMRGQGRGKSGSYRSIWFWKVKAALILIYFFPKNKLGNISEKEQKALKMLAKEYNALNSHQILQLIEMGKLIRIDHEN